jgi:excisionase family DNA binding protein
MPKLIKAKDVDDDSAKSHQKEMLHEKGYVATPEAAQRTGLTRQTIRNWIEHEIIHGVRVGGRWYVEWTSLVEHFRKTDPEAVKLLGLSR